MTTGATGWWPPLVFLHPLQVRAVSRHPPPGALLVTLVALLTYANAVIARRNPPRYRQALFLPQDLDRDRLALVIGPEDAHGVLRAHGLSSADGDDHVAAL